MAKIKYIDRAFRDTTLATIKTCNEIIAAYQAQGFRLTLRQLYYQLVSRGVIPNKQTEYDKLGSVINDARLAGFIDWNSIEDRTRNVEINSHWTEPSDIIKSAASSYRNDLWKTQPIRAEVWVEKDALEGVIETACRPWDVPFFSCRGYTSQTAMWEAGQRIRRYLRTPYFETGLAKSFQKFPKLVIFHLGDHDPSGIDMTRDIRDRLGLFVGRPVDVRRIALTMDQVEAYNPPPNPAKQTDSRFQSYVDQYGDESWELDALEPTVLVELIRDNLREVIDRDRWEDAVLEQEQDRAELDAIAANYFAAVENIKDQIEEPEIPDSYQLGETE